LPPKRKGTFRWTDSAVEGEIGRHKALTKSWFRVLAVLLPAAVAWVLGLVEAVAVTLSVLWSLTIWVLQAGQRGRDDKSLGDKLQSESRNRLRGSRLEKGGHLGLDLAGTEHSQ